MKESYIVRGKRRTNFTIIPNDVFSNKQISIRAIGLLCYLLHLPDDWRVVKKELHNNFKDGRDATSNAFNELIKAGYIMSEKKRQAGKFEETIYYVFDSPGQNPFFTPQTENPSMAPRTEKPDTVKPEPDKPEPEKPTLLSTNNNKELFNQDSANLSSDKLTGGGTTVNGTGRMRAKEKKPPVPRDPLYTEMIDVYWNWFKERNDGVPPKIDGAEGNAMKSLKKYMTEITCARMKKDGIQMQEDTISPRVLDTFNFVLNNWSRLEPFLQKQVKLTQINSNISNIINQFKNGRSTQTVQQQKQDRAGTISDSFNRLENLLRDEGHTSN